MKFFCAIVVFAALVATAARAAEEPASREDAIAAEQAHKAQRLEPPKPDRAEAIVEKVQGVLMVNPSGLFPYFDSVYQGGGLTGGAGYRKYYGDNTFWQVKGLYSVLNYKLIEGSTVSRDHFHGRLSFGTRLGWRDATQVSYFGLGPSSPKDDRVNYRFQQTYVDGGIAFRPRRWLPIRGTVGYENWNTLPGEGEYESIERRYNAHTAPGLGADPGYLHSTVSAGIDWRQSQGYSRRGGLYEVTFHDYDNINSGGAYSFRKLDAEVIQHVPVFRETWVLAGRGRMETTLNDNDVVPYFMLPSLGGGSSLRGYSSWRFRDRHSLLFNAELRWLPAQGLDMALFYDAGKVASRRSDLDFTGMKSDIGIGARFHGPLSTPLRIELAVSNEGWHVVFAGGPIF